MRLGELVEEDGQRHPPSAARRTARDKGLRKAIGNRFHGKGSKGKVITLATLIHQPGSKAKEPSGFGDPPPMASKGRVVLMICGICGKSDDHWSFKCPQAETFVDRSPAASGHAAPPTCQICMRRFGVMRRSIEDETSVRVSNLPKDFCERDLVDLCRFFGLIVSIYIAVDKTDSSKQFGTVEFGQPSDAEKAIRWLNGYAYNDVILQVEWAAPKPEVAYVPPVCPSCMRAAENCIRVTNLSEDISGRDLLYLFGRFGLVTGAYLAVDVTSGSRRQFGLVEYDRRNGAELAIRMLNGEDIDNLIVQVEGPFRLEDFRGDLEV